MITKYDYGIIVTNQDEELDLVLDGILQSRETAIVQSDSKYITDSVITVIRDYYLCNVQYIEYPMDDPKFVHNLSKYCENIIDLRSI